MKCPSCGNEMKPGKLYCENCGEDVHIVPDFEAEVEAHMQNHLESLKDVFASPKEEEKEKISKRQLFLYLGYAICVLCIIGFFGAGFYLLFQKDKSAVDYLEVARSASKAGKYEDAISAYENALKQDDSLFEAKLEMVELYFYLDDTTAYVDMLSSLIRDSSLSASQLSSCYGKLIAYYDKQGDIQAIQQLITGCNNSAIASQYEEYFAPKPTFDKQSGYYTSVMPVRITDSSKAGTIYYTLDGSEPNEKSIKYMAPIVLDSGKTVVKAVFISKTNVKSEIATATYNIEIGEPDAPTVLTVSGTYYEPTLIEVEIEDGDIYYTSDNSKPDQYATLYTGPIDMPYGKSVFRFVTVVGDKISDETERSFELYIESNYSSEQACRRVISHLVDKGEIHAAGDNAYRNGEYIRYEYLTSEVIHEKMYLVCAENKILLDGVTETIGYYGVEAKSGEVVKLNYESYRNYTISD